MRLVASRHARIVAHGDELFVLGARGLAHQLSGDSAELVRSVLALLVVARTRDEIVAQLARLAGAPIEDAEAVDETLALLRACGAIEPAAPRPVPPLRGRLLLAVSGAIAAAGSPELIARLQHAGFEVRVAMTRTARRFVSPLVLEALTHQRVHDSLWTRDEACPVPHINLAEWAELVLVCPASATTIARLAAGDCSELVSAIVTATRAPVVIVPSMNASMLASPRVQRNLGQLAADGCHVVHGGLGEELAQAPLARLPDAAGAMPLPAAVVDIACFVAARRPPLDWNALYAAGGATPSFCAARFDPDFGEALAARDLRSGRVLDVGTGTGTLALELARRGFTVSAIDLAPRALELARQRPGAEAVTWLAGDALTVELGHFDVVIDRGFLHGLDRAQQQQWAHLMTRATAPGALLLVKTFAAGARLPPAMHAFSPGELAALLSGQLTLETTWPSLFHEHETPALFAVFRRV